MQIAGWIDAAAATGLFARHSGSRSRKGNQELRRKI